MISAVVVNWNGRECLEACIRSVLRQQPAPDEVLLVDNHSEDGSRELVAEKFPEVRVIDTGHNAGPALARNIGVEQARGEHVLLVDNDVVLQPGALGSLAATMDRHPDAACVQARSLCADRPEVVHYDATDVHYLGLLVLHNWFCPLAKARDPEGATGGLVALCFLADKKKLLDIGGFNPALFILFEDTDLALRLRLRGYQVYLDPHARVLHGSGTRGTSFRDLDVGYPARRVFLHSRNRWLILLTSLRLQTLLVLLPAQLCYGLIQFVFAVVKLHPLAWFRGKLSQLRYLPRVLAWRQAAQEGRTVKDKDLLVGAALTLNPGLAGRGVGAFVYRCMSVFFAAYWKLFRRMCG
ncbi:MAG: glycosyltransferase family 2 protein [Planctomycetota bacterium]